jgi:outer membrane receptor protein involved in Fe transport
MRPSAPLAALLALAGPVLAQQPAESQEEPQDEAKVETPEKAQEDQEAGIGTTVITPTLSLRPLLDSPVTTAVIDAEDISERAYRTLPQALRDVPGVMVQETAYGHGSPYIRGFTSFRNLMLIDGVRLNNSVFRPGPNQYWNTVDAWSLDRLEVVKGPSSVLYGSDAMGGTVQAFTRSPWDYPADGALHGQISFRTADAANYDILRAEFGGALSPDTGIMVGLTAKTFGDVRGGKDVGRQPETGYDETDFDFKFEHNLDDNTRLTIAHQQVAQRNVPRTHRTVNGIDWEGLDVGSDLKREFDQDRALTYVQLNSVDTGSSWFDDINMGLSYQSQDEVRDRIKGSGAAEQQGFDVGTLGVFTHLTRRADSGTWTYGFEYYRDDVNSFLNKASGNSAADDIQGPVADDATYDLFGLFVQDDFAVNDRLDLIAGARWNFAAAKSDKVRDPVTNTRTSVDDSWDALVGSLRFVYDLDQDHTRLFGGVSQGFRAPNLSDLTRFDSAKSNEFEIPTTNLDPEFTTTVELGIRREDETRSMEASIFYTDVRDQILRVPTGNINGDGDFEVTKANVGNGELYGIELQASQRFAEVWTVFGFGAWLEGERSTFPTSNPVAVNEPFDKTMPLTMQLGLRWDDPGGALWGEAVVVWADKADALSSSDKKDSTRIPEGGTPGYTVLDLRGGYRASDAWSFNYGLENVFDEDYRIHGSGLNRPGRNLFFGLTFSF